jgi:hypothetical protein
MCRVVTGGIGGTGGTGGSVPFRTNFFNLQHVKTTDRTLFTKAQRQFNNLFSTDYTHQDAYMTRKLFTRIVKESIPLPDITNTIPLEITNAHTFIDIQTNGTPRPSLNCRY